MEMNHACSVKQTTNTVKWAHVVIGRALPLPIAQKQNIVAAPVFVPYVQNLTPAKDSSRVNLTVTA